MLNIDNTTLKNFKKHFLAKNVNTASYPVMSHDYPPFKFALEKVFKQAMFLIKTDENELVMGDKATYDEVVINLKFCNGQQRYLDKVFILYNEFNKILQQLQCENLYVYEVANILDFDPRWDPNKTKFFNLNYFDWDDYLKCVKEDLLNLIQKKEVI